MTTEPRTLDGFLYLVAGDDEGPIEILVDLRTHFQGRDSNGTLLIETWKGYGRPRYGRWTVGMFGSNFVNSDPCNYIPVYQVIGLDRESAAPSLFDTPLLQESHPSRYSRIANLWAKIDE